jgi:protein TonB
MFHESLLESSKSKKRKRWPMALAFAGEIAVTTVLVVIPLLTTGVISASAHVSPPISLTEVPVVRSRPLPNTPACVCGPTTQVFTVNNTRGSTIGPTSSYFESTLIDPDLRIGNSGPVTVSLTNDHYVPPTQGNRSRRALMISVASEAYLTKKVEPIYPHMAIVTKTQGDVKLHAIIAKDGTIESLSVISGHPLLVAAALEAVKQWRYKPYLLNGEPVEVETFVTVSFKGIRD